MIYTNQKYRDITIDKLNELIERIKKSAISNVDKALQSGAVPDSWKEDNHEYRLACAILDTICRDRPFKPTNVKTKKEFDNLYKFL